MTRTLCDELSEPVVQAYNDMEDEILALIGKQLGKYKRVTDTTRWRLRQLAMSGELDRRTVEIIASYAPGIDEGTKAAIYAAALTEAEYTDAVIREAVKKGILDGNIEQPASASAIAAVQAYQKQAEVDTNLVNTVMRYSARSKYVKAVNDIADQMLEGEQRQRILNVMGEGAAATISGQMSLQEATRHTIHKLARQGCPGFIDKAGREWTPEAYVSMDMRSTLGNAAREAQDTHCTAYGVNLISVSSHMGSRPRCAPFQGRIYSRDGTSGKTTDGAGREIEYIPLTQTSYGEPAGLFGINCGHQQYPFIPGVNVQRYFPYDEEKNAEVYKQTQKQRAMERQIRAQKRECMMLQEAGDEEGLKEASKKLRQYKTRYKDYSKEHGLYTHNERTQVYGYDRSKSMKTVWAEKRASTVKMAASSNDWSGAAPIIHTREEMETVSEFAKQYGVQIYNPAQFDGDLELLKEQITVIDGMKKEYGVNKKITIMFQDMKDSDFATSHLYTIKYNKNTLRNRSVTNKNLQADNFLAANDVNGVTAHEMGHIISHKHGEKGLDIAKEAYYNIYKSEPSIQELNEYLFENVSEYSTHLEEKLRGEIKPVSYYIHTEITSETVSKDMYGDRTAFSSEFTRLLKRRCLR